MFCHVRVAAKLTTWGLNEKPSVKKKPQLKVLKGAKKPQSSQLKWPFTLTPAARDPDTATSEDPTHRKSRVVYIRLRLTQVRTIRSRTDNETQVFTSRVAPQKKAGK